MLAYFMRRKYWRDYYAKRKTNTNNKEKTGKKQGKQDKQGKADGKPKQPSAKRQAGFPVNPEIMRRVAEQFADYQAPTRSQQAPTQTDSAKITALKQRADAIPKPAGSLEKEIYDSMLETDKTKDELVALKDKNNKEMAKISRAIKITPVSGGTKGYVAIVQYNGTNYAKSADFEYDAKDKLKDSMRKLLDVSEIIMQDKIDRQTNDRLNLCRTITGTHL